MNNKSKKKLVLLLFLIIGLGLCTCDQGETDSIAPSAKNNRTCHALSGGQRQRVAVARALVTDPAVLVADEITAMLEPSTQAVMLRELKAQQHERGFSMLFITHDIHLARKIADRVYVLDKGSIVEHGAVFDVLAGSAHKSAAAITAAVSENR